MSGLRTSQRNEVTSFSGRLPTSRGKLYLDCGQWNVVPDWHVTLRSKCVEGNELDLRAIGSRTTDSGPDFYTSVDYAS